MEHHVRVTKNARACRITARFESLRTSKINEKRSCDREMRFVCFLYLISLNSWKCAPQSPSNMPNIKY